MSMGGIGEFMSGCGEALCKSVEDIFFTPEERRIYTRVGSVLKTTGTVLAVACCAAIFFFAANPSCGVFIAASVFAVLAIDVFSASKSYTEMGGSILRMHKCTFEVFSRCVQEAPPRWAANLQHALKETMALQYVVELPLMAVWVLFNRTDDSKVKFGS